MDRQETAEACIYRMPDGSLRIQCGNCGALLTQLRILAGQRTGKFVPARCPECGASVSAGEHHVTHRSAITGEGGCDDFITPEADDEWCRALERAELRPVPWR